MAEGGGTSDAKMANGQASSADGIDTHREQVLTKSEFLEMMIVPSHFFKIVNELCNKHCFDGEILSQILRIFENKADKDRVTNAWKAFFNFLPTFGENWYWEFMSLLSDTAENRDARDYINPNYEEEIKTRNAALQLESASKSVATSASCSNESLNVKTEILGNASTSRVETKTEQMAVLEIDQSFEDWLNGVEFTSAGGHENYSQLHDSYDSDGSDAEDDIPPETLRLRNYQNELAEPAIAGRNTIVVAPTGSGKTIVAIEIIRRHLENNGVRDKRRKVVFLVPTVHLIEQQATMLNRYLRRSFKVKGVRGGQVGLRQSPKAMIVRANDVLVMTPQILLNLMIDPSPNVDPVPLDLFTLLIFDECHHTAKGNPYNEIMTQYLDAKFGATNPESKSKLPQVVGLTASLGVGGASSRDQAIAHVLSVCANMDARVLSTVVQFADELAEHVYVPTDELVRVPSTVSYTSDTFSVHVTNLIMKIEREFIKPMFDKLDKADTASARPKYMSNFDPPQKKYTSDYRSWIFAWLHELPVSQDVDTKQTLMTALTHLSVYHNSLFLYGHVTAAKAIDYLRNELTDFERRQKSEIDRQLVRLYKEEIIPHIQFGVAYSDKKTMGMVETLKKTLLDEFRSRPDGRALVFVCTRELTIALMEYMNEDAQLQVLRAARLAGVQASKAKGGQSASEQADLLEKFRSGHHRVLIVTSVAEEGLDVEKCNLIVKYNHVSDERAMVQRRGRGRAEGSRSILLAQSGSIEEQEMGNFLKEKMMIDAVERICRMGSDYFRDEVDKIQKFAYNDRQMAIREITIKRASFGGKIYDFLCKKCDTFIIASTDIRRVGQSDNVAVDPAIWTRVNADADELPKLFEMLVQAGRFFCAICNTECGRVLKYANVYLPALKADAFVQQCRDQTKHRHHVRKWKKVTDDLFVIDGINRDDLRKMFGALKSEATVRKFEERIRYAEQKQEEEKRQQEIDQEKSTWVL